MSHVPSRRDVLRGLAGAGIGLGALRLSDAVEARSKEQRKQRKRKKRNQNRLVFNRYGCLDIGRPCRGNSAHCCSGVCQGIAPGKGQLDRSRCVAHDTGGCRPEQDACAGAGGSRCGSNEEGICTRTTGNASFCTRYGECIPCRRDTDCQAVQGPGAACIVCPGDCPGTDTVCAVPAT